MALTAAETLTSRVSFFGRLADDMTRQTLPPDGFVASLVDHGSVALNKYDGFFVFSDLGPLGTSYQISLAARSYQDRTLAPVVSADSMVEVSAAGEDEVYLAVTAVLAAPQNRITFERLTFVPRIAAGAHVIGDGTVDTTLAEPLEGRNQDFTTLADVTGITPGSVLRVVRSNRIVMRPGPYYAFPAGSTLAVVTVVEDDPLATPVPWVALQIDQVNDAVPGSVAVAGLTLRTIVQPGTPPVTVVLGPDSALQTVTDLRGRAVFYYPSGHPVTRLHLTASKSGYVATPTVMDLTLGARQATSLVLPRI